MYSYINCIFDRYDEKSKILNYYTGETAKKYVSLFEKTLTNKEVCFHYLKKDWFFHDFLEISLLHLAKPLVTLANSS